MKISRLIYSGVVVTIFSLLLIAVPIGAAPMAQEQQPSEKVEQPPIAFIKVEGTQRVEEETVLAYIVVREGMRPDPQLIDQSVKTLFASGLFADVSIRRENDGLIITVIENPIINRVSFEGNSKITDENLSKESTLRPRLVYTRAKVQDDVERFLELYRRAGRFSARIEPKVIQLPQNRVDLIFEISEGPVTGIRAINFIGNDAFDDGRLMEEIATSETRWWKFLSSNDNYDPDRIAYDRELLRQFYLARGYADFRVISSTAELTREGDAFFVTFNLEEGQVYDFTDSSIETSLEKIQALDLSELIKHEAGDRYDLRKIDSTVDELTKIVGEQGFAFADIRPRVRRDPENRLISVAYLIEEGPRVYVERININGNTRTQDEVIRRELRLSEGDGFNRVLLSRSERSVKGLDFFANVDVVEQPGTEPDQTIIDIDVQEKATGELTLGVGFSSTENFSTQFSIGERNLLGRGQQLQFSVNASSEVQQFVIGFTEPYFMKRDVSAGFRVFNTAIDYDDENTTRDQTGATFSLSFPMSEDSRLSLFATAEQDSTSFTPSAFLVNNYGYRAYSYDRTKISLGYFYGIDKRDDFIDTTSGWNIGFGQDIAGPAGDVTFLRTTANADYYYPIAEGFIFHAGLDLGHIYDYENDGVRYQDRFFRGASSFRGFDRSGVGPRDIVSDTAAGANQYAIATTEVQLPLGIPKELGMKTKAFIDFGAIGEVDPDSNVNLRSVVDEFAFRATYGLSVSWKSPIGPIQFDFARPIVKEDYDKERFFRFTAGTRF